MKKKLLAIASIIMATFMVAGIFAGCGGSGDGGDKDPSGNIHGTDKNPGQTDDDKGDEVQDDEDKSVSAISIKKAPDKSEYYVDEDLSLEGGIVTVTYDDNSVKDVPLTDPMFTISNVNMAMAGSKTITVKCNGKKDTFKITVRIKGSTAYFDYNYEGAPAAEEVNIVKGYPPQRPDDPERDGYTFYDWYKDEACTVLYDFYEVVDGDVTIYAQWKQDGAEYVEFTYDLNYYGCPDREYPQLIRSGEKSREVAATPQRTDYEFTGWFTDADCTKSFDAQTAITADTTVYAGWEKTKTGVSTYIFEAENTDLSDKKGPGYSGENAGFGMAVDDEQSLGASGGKYVSYMYKYGNSLEFYVASDCDADNVTLTVRLGAEYNNINLTPDIYEISVNGQATDYDAISIALPAGQEVSPFSDFVISANVSLKEGENLIQLKTINNISMGPTLFSTAPVIDCIKITTEAVVIWDGTHGLPAGL